MAYLYSVTRPFSFNYGTFSRSRTSTESNRNVLLSDIHCAFCVDRPGAPPHRPFARPRAWRSQKRLADRQGRPTDAVSRTLIPPAKITAYLDLSCIFSSGLNVELKGHRRGRVHITVSSRGLRETRQPHVRSCGKRRQAHGQIGLCSVAVWHVNRQVRVDRRSRGTWALSLPLYLL